MSEKQDTDLHHQSVSQSKYTCGSRRFFQILLKLQTKPVNRIPSLPDILCDYPIYAFKQYALEKVFYRKRTYKGLQITQLEHEALYTCLK